MNFRILYFVIVIVLFSCKKSGREQARLYKDCTGIYFYIDGEYYNVCNRDDFFKYPSGIVLNINYRITEKDGCDPNASGTCWLQSPSNGKWIFVKVIN